MNHLKHCLFGTLLSVVYLFSTGSAFANEAIKLVDGIHLSTDTPRLGDNLTVSFSLQETQNTAVNNVQLQLLMQNARSGARILLGDFGLVNFAAGQTKQFGTTYSLAVNNNLMPGNYALAAVYTSVDSEVVVIDDIGYAANRVWIDVQPTTLGFEGYLYMRTDKDEFRWVGRLPNGQFGHSWIDERCANAIGAAPQSGDWLQLSYLAPAGESVIANPCSVGLVTENPNLETLEEGANAQEPQIQPAVTTSDSATGFVFSRTDSNELRWIGETTSGQSGHTWIDEQCAQSLGGISSSGTWSDLQAMAPAGDGSVSNPCELRREVPSGSFVNDGEGYVFAREHEYRWISRTPSGEFGHTWISAECALALGGNKVVGDWQRLISLAPAGDQTVSNPCESIRSFVDGGEGYVYGRTDANEYRWVDRTPNGEIGHTWIDEQCAQSLGGVRAKGSWSELRQRAPAGDGTVEAPC